LEDEVLHLVQVLRRAFLARPKGQVGALGFDLIFVRPAGDAALLLKQLADGSHIPGGNQGVAEARVYDHIG